MWNSRARMIGLDSAQFSIYTSLPGTNAFSKALRNNKLRTLDWVLYNCLHPILKTHTGPFWLLIKTGVGEAAFYIKKWLSASFARAEPSYYEYSILVRNITRFVSKNLAKYTKETFLVPWNALKVWSKLRKPKDLDSDIEEILNRPST